MRLALGALGVGVPVDPVGRSSDEVLPDTCGQTLARFLSIVSRNCVPLMPFDLSASFLTSLLQLWRYHLSTLGAAEEKQVSQAASHRNGLVRHSLTTFFFLCYKEIVTVPDNLVMCHTVLGVEAT